MRIILLFEPSPDRTVPFAAGPERYQRLAEELSRYAGVQVQIIKDVLQKAPADAYVLFAGSGDLSRSLANCGPMLAAQLAPRIVLLDVSWQKALEQLEKHRLAGAVDSLRLNEWLARPSSCTGPFGLRYLTKPLGAFCVPMPAFRSAHYCLIQSKHHRGMPHLLADYLMAYDRDQKPLHGLPSVPLARFVQAFIDESGDRPWKAAGDAEQSTSISSVECVSTKRAAASLKPVRELAGMTLLQVAESAGLDPEQLGLLEQGDLVRTTLGTLRGYILALAPKLGWTLVGLHEACSSVQQKTEDQIETGGTSDRPIIVSDTAARVTGMDTSEWCELLAHSPVLMFEGRMTVLRNRRFRRREPQGELDKPAAWNRRDETYGGV